MRGPLDLARELTKTSRLVSVRTVTAGVAMTLVAWLILLGLLDYTFRFDRGARSLLAVVLFSFGFAARRFLARRYRPLDHETHAASFVERRRKNLKSLFLTGVEAEAGRSRGDREFTDHVVRDAAVAIGTDVLDHIDRTALVRIGRVTVAILTVALIFVLIDPSASARHGLRILLPTAAIDPATATRIRVTPGDVVITRGDSVLILAVTTGALPPDATLILTDETGVVTRLPMDVASGEIAERIFEVFLPRVDVSFRYEILAGDARTYPYTIEIRLEDGDDIGARAHRDLQLAIIEDRPPLVEILSPLRAIKAVATEEIAFDIVVTDDIGLARIRIHLAVADETEIVWKTLEARGESASASFVLPLEAFSLEVGDAVHLRVEGVDVAGGVSNRERLIQIQPYARYARYRAELCQGLEALMPSLRKFIALEEGVIMRTTESLGAGRPAMGDAADHQERVRADLAEELQKLREIMKTDDPLDRNRVVIDGVFIEAERAADEMTRARDRLRDGKGAEGLRAERAALNHLMKAYQSILTIVTSSANPRAGKMEKELEEQLENLPVEAAPRQSRSGAEENTRSGRETRPSRSGAEENTRSGRETRPSGERIDHLESVRGSTSARDTIADLLERIENDPDFVPPEMREIVRRYFELLR